MAISRCAVSVLALLACASACASSASPDLGFAASPEPAGPSPLDDTATLAPIMDDDVAGAFHMLMQARPPVVYGASCGFVADDPPGRRAINALRARLRWDLVKKVLHGASPGGRLYAAEALLARAGVERMSEDALARLPVEEARALRELGRDDSTVEACFGCVFGMSTVANELARMWVR
jgi:hypothetical protein